MNIRVEPGTWVVAVSGGVDSMVLLDLVHQLRRRYPRRYRFTVAHLDHGIRPDSAKDRKLVQRAAQQYDLPFVYHEAHLGPDASEAQARQVRYEFLDAVRRATGARGVITAHHRDDALETAAHHLMRGTGRRGVTALSHHERRARPLLHVDKQALRDHAHAQNIRWREDSTNQDIRYTRNYIRHRVLANATPGQRAQLGAIIDRVHELNRDIDTMTAGLLHIQPSARQIDRRWFTRLPHAVAREVVYAWFRTHDVQNINRPMVERAVIAMKAGRVGASYRLGKQRTLLISKTVAELTAVSTPKTAKKSV
jgi:tRNA(Ile)-lysidine synthetase-like protein